MKISFTWVVTVVAGAMALVASNSKVALASGNLNPEELNLWKSIYDQTNGEEWRRCSDRREHPNFCSWPNVRVEFVENRIQKLLLANNNLAGEFPTEEIQALFDFEFLSEIDFRDNAGLTSDSCIDLPRCHSPGITCSLPSQLQLCPKLDVVLWQDLYDTLGGSQWQRCSGNRENPCDCDAGPNKKVVCHHGHITRIILRNNNFQGTEFPASILNELMQLANLVEFDFLNNNNFEVDSCVHMSECYRDDTICGLPENVELCEETDDEYDEYEEYENPTDPPTDAPTNPPTDAPTNPPTDAPTNPPTDAPTNPPTDAPTNPPTNPPTHPPVDDDVPELTAAPTLSISDPTKPPSGTETVSNDDDEESSSNVSTLSSSVVMVLAVVSMIVALF